jgi:hypothetical protein
LGEGRRNRGRTEPKREKEERMGMGDAVLLGAAFEPVVLEEVNFEVKVLETRWEGGRVGRRRCAEMLSASDRRAVAEMFEPAAAAVSFKCTEYNLFQTTLDKLH